jgi:hypothetical protein
VKQAVNDLDYLTPEGLAELYWAVIGLRDKGREVGRENDAAWFGRWAADILSAGLANCGSEFRDYLTPDELGE